MGIDKRVEGGDGLVVRGVMLMEMGQRFEQDLAGLNNVLFALAVC